MTTSYQIRRIFVVGSSRSGTTVLQRVLSERLGLVTLPETDFFGIAGGGGLLRRWMVLSGWASRRSSRALERLRQMLATHGYEVDSTKPYRFREVVERFVHALDALAVNSGASGWLEKTPKHFRHVRLIEKYVPGAHFVHLVRAGPDVVASVVERARKHPERFSGQDDPHYAIRMWNSAVATANRHVGRPNHTVLLYEEFCRAPKQIVMLLAGKLNLVSTQLDNTLPPENREIYTIEETWKSKAMGPIAMQPSKFFDVFEPVEQARIMNQLNLEAYDRLKRRLEIFQ